MSNREIEEIETDDNDRNESVHTELQAEFHSVAIISSHYDDIAEMKNIGSDDAHYQPQEGFSISIQINGSDRDDDIFGNDGNDILTAGIGNDHLEGREGNDDIEGDEGDDELHAGIGNDHLDGGDGNDTLFGDDGDDVLRAGFGNDILTGGAGFDDFTFYAGGDFKVTDYNTSDDSLVFDSATTGLHDLNDLLRVITNISDTTEGVVIEFGQVATITLVGLTIADLNAGMVHFS